MTKLQSGMLSLVMLCLVLNGVTRLVAVPTEVRHMGVACLAVVCFLASLFFFFGPRAGKKRLTPPLSWRQPEQACHCRRASVIDRLRRMGGRVV